MDMASIVKAITERSSLLFGGMFAAAVFLVADLAGRLPGISRDWLYGIYLLGLVCAGALVYGVVSWGGGRWSAAWSLKQKAKHHAARGLRNFETLLPQHRAILVYLKANNMRRFPVEDVSSVLEEMRGFGLLSRETGNVAHTGATYYNVPDPLWDKMVEMGWPAGQIIPADPPWLRPNWRASSVMVVR